MTEAEVENIALSVLSNLGWEAIHAPDIAPDGMFKERESYSDVVLITRLRAAVYKINPQIPEDAKEEAIKKVLRVNSPNLLSNNKNFHKMLTDGVDVEYRPTSVDGEGMRVRYDKVWLIDFENTGNNEFVAASQFTIIEGQNNKRPDVILFVNGLPLTVIELKNPSDEKATTRKAFDQLQTYLNTIPSLFTYNAVLAVSDGLDARAGTISSDWSRFMSWKTYDGENMAPSNSPLMDVMLKGMFTPKIFLDLLRHFIVFEEEKERTIKKIAAYHQYHSVNKAIEKTIQATGEKGDKRCGVIWHTQGSGKSLSMVFYTGKLVLSLNNPTIIVLTDRNDLDDQLFDTFANCNSLLRQAPVQAENKDHLKKLLGVASGGIVFTTIQKFLPEIKGDKFPMLSERRNIIVIADEAHRSQYDFIDGYARHMRDALPNASFIGFTGTPIEKTDKNTRAVFGDYIDIYDIEQGVDDGATVRIYYESRLAKINIKEDERPTIDAEFEEVTESEEISEKQKLKSKWARMEALVGNQARIEMIAGDIVNHFEQRTSVLEGKAMIVCMSRRICVDMYNEIIKLRPEWHNEKDEQGLIKVVMTGSSSDKVEWQQHIRSKQRRREMRSRMKDENSGLKIIIVRDMFLTGFDAPCLHTMYIDKPMHDANLMQAIARVNRVFKDKQGGLLVDYLGIAQDLKKALSVYSESGGRGKPAFNQEDAVAVMLEKYELVKEMFEKFEYSKYFKLPPAQKLSFILDATDYVLGLEDGKQRFVAQVTKLLQSFAISVPHEKAMAIRDEVGLFQSIKARIVKVGGDTLPGEKSKEDIETAIRQIVSKAIVSEEMVDVYAAAGMNKPEISILSDDFLSEVKGMKHRNLALELLKRLINDEIKSRMKQNLVLSRSFLEMLEEAVKRYQNNIITAAQVIEELIELARQVRDANKRGEELNLKEDEFAFYNALEVNDSAVKILGDEILRTIARELVENVRKNVSIDWTIKESVQSNLRAIVKRILRKYGYPPDKQAKAVETVMLQAELLADEWVK